jgi:hypothetical protein
MKPYLAELPGHGPRLPFGQQTSAGPVSHYAYVLLLLSGSLESRPT